MPKRRTSATSPSAHQLRDRLAVVDDRRRPAIEIVDHHPRGIDAEVVVDRRQEIPRRAAALGDILPLAIGGPDHAAGLDAAKPRIVNVAGGVESWASLRQLSRWCEERFGANAITASAEERPYDIPWMALDAARAQEAWGWRPALSLYAILAGIADFAEQHPQWLSLSLG